MKLETRKISEFIDAVITTENAKYIKYCYLPPISDRCLPGFSSHLLRELYDCTVSEVFSEIILLIFMLSLAV